MFRSIDRRVLLWLGIVILTSASAVAQQVESPPRDRASRARRESGNRADSLYQLAEHLGIGQGSVIADIGAGNGRDTWVFADIVGTTGKVLAEEIEENKTKAIAREAGNRNYPQVEVVLGSASNPSLPANSADMAFMHHVYHHLTKPRDMLRGIWRGLQPGGYLVVVDRRLGTLVDWVPREVRGKKHYWIAETTVVREAREEGFLFVECGESYWHAGETFVLIFQRPSDSQGTDPGGDPDMPARIEVDAVQPLLMPPDTVEHRIAFVALGQGRRLMGPMLDSLGCPAVDIVLEEWATQKEERPTPVPNRSIPSVLTESGDPRLGAEPIDAVYFLDTYHRLFHGPVLLARLRERLAPNGRIYVLDRRASRILPRREASHRRRIAPETVKEEMGQADFTLVREVGDISGDRFLLVFRKTDGESGDPTFLDKLGHFDLTPKISTGRRGRKECRDSSFSPLRVSLLLANIRVPFVTDGRCDVTVSASGVVDMSHERFWR